MTPAQAAAGNATFNLDLQLSDIIPSKVQAAEFFIANQFKPSLDSFELFIFLALRFDLFDDNKFLLHQQAAR